MVDEGLKWIPCSEKLPETECLACDESGKIFIVHNLAFTEDECYEAIEFFSDETLYGLLDMPRDFMYALGRKIIAWMPLPEPYNPIEGAMNPPEEEGDQKK